MECPKCHGAMQRVTAGQYEVDRCASCSGLWFDLREHDHLKEDGAARSVDTGNADKGRQLDDVRDILCPRDGSTLVKLNSLEQPHIRYEQCSVCGGAFFDAGEFRDLQSTSWGEWFRGIVPGLQRR